MLSDLYRTLGVTRPGHPIKVFALSCSVPGSYLEQYTVPCDGVAPPQEWLDDDYEAFLAVPGPAARCYVHLVARNGQWYALAEPVRGTCGIHTVKTANVDLPSWCERATLPWQIAEGLHPDGDDAPEADEDELES